MWSGERYYGGDYVSGTDRAFANLKDILTSKFIFRNGSGWEYMAPEPEEIEPPSEEELMEFIGITR